MFPVVDEWIGWEIPVAARLTVSVGCVNVVRLCATDWGGGASARYDAVSLLCSETSVAWPFLIENCASWRHFCPVL